MSQEILKGRRILVIEDEYLIASDLISTLENAGATVYGPVSDLERAMEVAAACFPIDGAVLDINLHGEMVYPAAAVLSERDIPLVFVTGYECASISQQFIAAHCLQKPFDQQELVRLLATQFNVGQA